MKTFKQTCDRSYDRHTYELVLTNGKRIPFEYYDEASYVWMHTPDEQMFLLSHIEVIDRVKSKGFK